MLRTLLCTALYLASLYLSLTADAFLLQVAGSTGVSVAAIGLVWRRM